MTDDKFIKILRLWLLTTMITTLIISGVTLCFSYIKPPKFYRNSISFTMEAVNPLMLQNPISKCTPPLINYPVPFPENLFLTNTENSYCNFIQAPKLEPYLLPAPILHNEKKAAPTWLELKITYLRKGIFTVAEGVFTASIIMIAILFLPGRFIHNIGRTPIIMCCISLIICMVNFFATNYNSYALDVPGHTNYIKFLATYWRLPEPFGWQTQQPPAYYIIGAILYKIGGWIGMPDPFNMVRCSSLLLYGGFIILSLLILKEYLSGKSYIAAAALVLFWPDGYHYAARISNDLGMLFLISLTLYLMIRWWKTENSHYLIAGFFIAFFSITVKGNGVIAIAAVAALASIALHKKKISWRILVNPYLLVFSITCIGINFGRTFYYRMKGADVKWFLNLNTQSMQSILHMRAPYNFLYFDFLSFIRDPFYMSQPDGGIYLWNAFLKTLILGEWTWQSPMLACTLSFLLVIFLIFILSYLFLKPRMNSTELCPPLAIMMLCMLAMLISACIAVPWTAQANGRYIFGIIVIFSIYLMKSLEWHYRQGRRLLYYTGMGSVILFPILSIFLNISELALKYPAW